jgi:hypothetical protein
MQWAAQHHGLYKKQTLQLKAVGRTTARPVKKQTLQLNAPCAEMTTQPTTKVVSNTIKSCKDIDPTESTTATRKPLPQLMRIPHLPTTPCNNDDEVTQT